MATVKTTKNYEMFELHAMNRDLGRTAPLEQSMARHGWIDAYPMHVIKNGGGTFRIKAGHHRFEVAKKLGIPVKYIVCDDDAEIQELENASRGWSLRDYLLSYQQMGLADYVELADYCNRTKLGITSALHIMGGAERLNTYCGARANIKAKFKSGKFVVVDRHTAQVVGEIVLAASAVGHKFATSGAFAMSVARAAALDEFDHERMIDRIKRHPSRLKRRSLTRDYDAVLESVYNWHMPKNEKLYIAHLIQKAQDEKAAGND